MKVRPLVTDAAALASATVVTLTCSLCFFTSFFFISFYVFFCLVNLHVMQLFFYLLSQGAKVKP